MYKILEETIGKSKVVIQEAKSSKLITNSLIVTTVEETILLINGHLEGNTGPAQQTRK